MTARRTLDDWRTLIMTKRHLILTLTATVFAASCMQQPAAPPDTRAADEAAIRAADVAWAKVAETKDANAHVAFYTPDAVLLPPNEPLATGAEAVRKTMTDLYAL